MASPVCQLCKSILCLLPGVAKCCFLNDSYVVLLPLWLWQYSFMQRRQSQALDLMLKQKCER